MSLTDTLTTSGAIGLASTVGAARASSDECSDRVTDSGSVATSKECPNSAESTAACLAAAVELVSRLHSADSLQEACERLVKILQKHCQADHVVVGQLLRQDSGIRVMADSRSESSAVPIETTRAAEVTLQESLIRGGTSVWPPAPNRRHSMCCHRQYAQTVDAKHFVTMPISLSDGKTWGAILVAFIRPADPVTMSFLAATAEPIAGVLHLFQRAQKGRIHQAACDFFCEAKRNRRKTVVWIVAAVICLLMVPMRYKIKADCQLEPTHKHFVAAPFDTRLSECLVRPGDVVQKGETIARLDGREIRWELAAVNAELQRAVRQRAGHVVAHESGEAKLIAHEIEHLESRQQLLEDRIAQLEICSPADGVIVSGDLTDSVGAPLTVGQTLIEVASLENMVAEIAIPETEVGLVKSTQDVSVQLHALGGQKLPTRVAAVHPRSESRDQQNVFIAEAVLDNVESQNGDAATELRPGMKGTARIASVYRPIGWILFRKPFVSLRMITGW